jgi:glycosyltransferase involved in cell wall biosynthesis
MDSASAMSPRPGVVVIGRNEGERLLACLQSVQSLGCPVVYVDSGSSDGSLERAAALSDLALALDPLRPLSAARARNEGFRALLAARPELRLIQFLDGDCTLLPGWLEAAE